MIGVNSEKITLRALRLVLGEALLPWNFKCNFRGIGCVHVT